MELKAKGVDDVYLEYFNTGKHDLAQVYLKTEADKAIADLEESHKKKVRQLLILNREQNNAANRLRDSMEQVIRHSKYKRCLAMARWCDAELEKLDYKESKYYTYKDAWRIATSYFTIWHNRWLELAEKFKEAK